jgi:hypothetical protein
VKEQQGAHLDQRGREHVGAAGKLVDHHLGDAVDVTLRVTGGG